MKTMEMAKRSNDWIKIIGSFQDNNKFKNPALKTFLIKWCSDVDQRCEADVAAQTFVAKICCGSWKHLFHQLALSYSCLIWADATHHESQKPRKDRQMPCWWKLWWWWLNRQARWLWRMVTCDSRNSLISQLLCTTYPTLQYNTATILLWTITPSTAMIHQQCLGNILYECTLSDE